MRVSKDVLGIIILKLSYPDVLNLRATSKDLRDVIATFNKFWFLKYLKRWAKFNQFDRYLCTHINYSYRIDNYMLDISYIQCLTPNEMKKYAFRVVREHEKYNSWLNEFERITKSDFKRIRKAYIREKYLKDKYPNHKCKNLEHYSKSIDEKYLEQTNINVINDALILYYCFEFSYFDLFVSFKPKHARCSYCKTIYPDDSTFYIIDNLGVNRNVLNYYWRNLEKPKYLKIGEHLCDYCVRDFVHQGLFQ
jgi:hypothetical protein